MGEDRQQLTALGVIAKGVDLLACERPGEPLHVVLDEHLHGRASDGAGPLDRHVYTARDRHVRTQEDFLCHVERSRDISHQYFLNSKRFLDCARNDKDLKSFWVPVRVLKTAFADVFEKLVDRREQNTRALTADAKVEIEFVVEEVNVAMP